MPELAPIKKLAILTIKKLKTNFCSSENIAGGKAGKLIEWITANEAKLSPVVVSAIAHYNMVRIHPLDDGKGRGARILMDLILMRGGYPPAIIKVENREDYIQTI